LSAPISIGLGKDLHSNMFANRIYVTTEQKSDGELTYCIKLISKNLYTFALLSEVCYNVRTEPSFQPLSGEQFHYRTANVEDDAHLDVSAESF